MQQVEQSIKLMDPIQVLKRGYSITLFNGKTISEETKLEEGMTLLTKTFLTEFESEITKIKSK